MKIGKEYVLATVAGLFLLAYVLQSGVKPLTVGLSSPYAFLNPVYWQTYPFTTAIIIIRSLALFTLSLLILSFFGRANYAKGSALLVASGLAQLYALQEIITKSKMVALEWSLSLALAGLGLLLPTLIFFLKGMTGGIRDKITDDAPDPFSKDL